VGGNNLQGISSSPGNWDEAETISSLSSSVGILHDGDSTHEY
jgi:hypothetical protein